MADDHNSEIMSPTASPKKRGGLPRTRPRSPQVHVVVDEERIRNSVRRDSRHCMISEAIQVAAPDLATISTDLQSIRFTDPKRRLRFAYMTPRIAQLALIDFDQGVQPEPFSFWLRRPSTITRHHGGKSKGRTDAEKRAAKRKREREIRALQDQIRAPEGTEEPWQPPAEYAAKVVAALDDPNADLGPAVMLMAPTANETGAPITVGGNPPMHGGGRNIVRKRMFGLRELVR
jgi:hypothetical protein